MEISRQVEQHHQLLTQNYFNLFQALMMLCLNLHSQAIEKYRSSHLMFRFNSVIMHRLKSFYKFNALQIN